MESPRFENQSDAESFIRYLKDKITKLYDSKSHPESSGAPEEWCDGYASAVDDIWRLIEGG